MKTKLSLYAICLSTSIIAISACNNSAAKLDNATENAAEANADLDEAQKEYQADVVKYKIETAEKIAENQRLAIEYRAKASSEKKEVQEDYNRRLDELETRNNNLKISMEKYNPDDKTSWETFKTEFNRDMDELGKAFNDLGNRDSK